MTFLKNWFKTGKSIPLLVLLFLLIISSISAQTFPRFTTKNIPLLQGKYSKVGDLLLDSSTHSQVNKIEVALSSTFPLAGLRVMGHQAESDPIILAEKILPSATERLALKRNLTVAPDKIWIEIMPQKDHDLLDKIKVEIRSITLGKKNVKLSQDSTTAEFKIAHELRNYGMEGVHSFRIPGLVTTPKGTLLAVYDIRHKSSVDLQGDIDVGLSRSTDQGKTWSEMKTIIDMGSYGGLPEDQNGVGDPAILVDPQTGHIWVIALWAHGKPGVMIWNSSKPGLNPEETGQLVLVKSEDDGLTWSDPVNITTQVKDPKWNLFFNGPGKGIAMNDGTLIFPAQYRDEEGMPYSTIISSQDKGKTWAVGSGAKSNTTEAQVVELSDRSLMLNMRDNRGGARSVSVTSDLGKNWTEHSSSRSALIEPVCMASIISHPTRDLLLFSNPAATDGRHNMTIKVSEDEGKTWSNTNQLLLDEGSGWGYSCLTIVDEGLVGIVYESSVANITFQLVRLEDLIQK